LLAGCYHARAPDVEARVEYPIPVPSLEWRASELLSSNHYESNLRKATMVDAVITGSGVNQWTIHEEPGEKLLGIILHKDDHFTIMPAKNRLAGICLGPYTTGQDAMGAVGDMLGGTCAAIAQQ
jgi:hypothetical protein